MVMITQDPAGRQKNPALSGNYLVWTGRPPDGMSTYDQIYLYDIAGQKTTRITDDEYDHGAVINGNRILWTDRTGIVLYNITSGQKTQVIRDSSGNARCPQISGDTVTWQDRRHLSMTIGGHANYGLYAIWEGSTEIYTYDLATGTETRITNDSYSQGCPVIEGNTIVWADDRNRALDIILYDLRTGTRKQIITGRSDFVEPKIYRNRVFWKDRQNISMYDIGAGALEQIPAGPFDHSGYTLSGDLVLWGGGYRSPTGLEIYEIPYGKITPINGSTYVNYPAADQQHVAGVLVNPELRTDGGNIILYTLPDRFSSPTTPYVLTPVSGQQTGEKVPGFVGIFAIFGCFCIMVMRKLLQVNP
jgi:beta propeller repeat protein